MVRVRCQFLLSQSLWHLVTGGSSYEWSEEVTHPMCGLSHHIGSQGLFTYIQPWPASTMLCLCSRSQKTCQTEHFYYSGMFHLPPSTGCCSGLVCDLCWDVFSRTRTKPGLRLSNLSQFWLQPLLLSVTLYYLKCLFKYEHAPLDCTHAEAGTWWFISLLLIMFIGVFTVHNHLQC